MKLILTGNDLTMEHLFSSARGEIDEYEIKGGDNCAEQTAAIDGGGQESIRYLGDELCPEDVSAMSLALLANAAARMTDTISSKTRAQLLTALRQKDIPALHIGYFDEGSAMAELLHRVLPEISDSETAALRGLCCVSTAMAAALLRRGEMLVRTADLCVAMNLEAIRGEPAAFDARLHELGRPFPGQIESAACVRRFIDGSGYTTENARELFGYDTAPRCQDAICVRAAPQTHGGVRDSLAFLRSVLDSQLNEVRAGANPILAHAVEHVTTALADLGNISERRSFRLLDTHLSYGLPDNLVYEAPGYNHGMPVVQEAATALLGELKLMALPAVAGADSEYLMQNGIQYLAAKKALRAVPLLEKILAVEVMMAAQAIDLARKKLPDLPLGKGTAAAYSLYRQSVSVAERNRYLVKDLNTTHRIIADGLLTREAETATRTRGEEI